MSTTFYLGAGASANALPCVADLTKKIKNVFDFINENRPNGYPFSTFTKDFAGDTIRVDDTELMLNWNRLQEIEQRFLNQLGRTLSIDTMARILYIQERQEEYLELKGILVASFLLWERKNGIDKRYENFWATIAVTDNEKKRNEPVFKGFAPRLNIVSWNYDNQLESSLSELFAKSKYVHSIVERHIQSKDISSATGIPYIKLNGTAQISSSRSHQSRAQRIDFENFSDSDMSYLLAALILFPQKFTEECKRLRFCWEGIGINNKDRFTKFKKDISETETLVVIGYSFPSINHKLDKEIISCFHSLRTVYFQGANKQDSERIMDAFKSVRGAWDKLNLHPVEAAGFFIPPDVTLPKELGEVPVW